MNRKMIFFAGILSCFVTGNFFAAEKSNKMELVTIKKAEFIPLEQGLKTLVPKILVSWDIKSKKINEILSSDDELWTLKGLMGFNCCFGTDRPLKNLFLPLIIKVRKDTSIVKDKVFDSNFACAYTTESCRQKKAVFYPYKQGAIIDFFRAERVDIELLKNNEAALKKMIDEAAKEESNLLLPVIA